MNNKCSNRFCVLSSKPPISANAETTQFPRKEALFTQSMVIKMDNGKYPAKSFAVLSDMMLPDRANPAGNVHGGEIVKMMDNCGSVAAMRHSRTNVVTVKIDKLVFYTPIKVGQLVTCESKPVFAGRTSIEVMVTTYVEDIQKHEEKHMALTGLFTFVALGNDGKPTPVPRLLPQTAEEMEQYEKGQKRYEKTKKERE